MDATADRSPLPETLPHTFSEAAIRGMKGHCPRCGGASLFRKWLKVVDKCSACGQDWSLQRADDLPAYISLFITGHVVVPIMMLMILDWGISAWTTAAVGLPLTVLMAVAILQPAKGATVALMWWMGMHGFRQERRPVAVETDTTAP